MVTGRVMLIVALSVFLLASSAARGEEVTSGLAEVNGTKLYYEMMGEGPPLVLIHAGNWIKQTESICDPVAQSRKSACSPSAVISRTITYESPIRRDHQAKRAE